MKYAGKLTDSDTMKTLVKILKHANAILPVVFLLFGFPNDTTGQLSNKSEQTDLKILDKIIKEINWDTDSKYLFYHNVPASVTETDGYQDMEIWMVDLTCWNSAESEELNAIACVLEFEYDYPVEDWMIREFTTDLENNTDMPVEENYPVEDWMYNLRKFQVSCD